MELGIQGQLKKLRFGLIATGFFFLSACAGATPGAGAPAPTPFAGPASLANVPSLPNESPAPGFDPDPEAKYKIHEETRASEHITSSGVVALPAPPPFQITIDGRVFLHTVKFSGAQLLEDGRVIFTEKKEIETPFGGGQFFRIRDVATDTCDYFALGEGGILHATIRSTQEKPLLEFVLYPTGVGFTNTHQQTCPPENFLGGTQKTNELISDFKYPLSFRLQSPVFGPRTSQVLEQAMEKLTGDEAE